MKVQPYDSQRISENIFLDGNIEAATLLLPYALQLMRMAVATGIQVMHKEVDSSSIRVERVGGLARIYITGDVGFYMESGIFDMQANLLNGCSEASYLPAILNYTAWMDAYINSVQYPMQGKTKLLKTTGFASDIFKGQDIPSGSLSNSLGCSGDNQLSTISPCSVEYNGAPYYCEDLFVQKYAQRYLPASNFSGKLTLMVQAIYGSKRRDYYLRSSVFGQLDIDSFIISTGYKPSYGLITTRDYKYYIVKILNESTSYYPVKLTSKAEKFLDTIRSLNNILTSEAKKRVEAYALSTATVGQEGVITGNPINAPLGIPLGYGWQWNWDGSEADVAVNYENGDDYKYTIIHYNLKISYYHKDDGTIVFDETLSVVSSDQYWPIGVGLHLIKPVPALSTMLVMPLAQGSGTPIPIDEKMTDVTVHVYRPPQSDLVICKYSQDFEERFDTVSDQGYDVCFESNVEGFYVNNKTHNGIQGTNSLDIGGAVTNGSIESLSSKNIQKNIPVSRGTSDQILDNSNITVLNQFIINHNVCSGETLRDWGVARGYLEETVPGTGSYKFSNTGGTYYCAPISQDVDKFYAFRVLRGIWDGELIHSLNVNNQNTQSFLMVPFNSSSSIYTSRRATRFEDTIRGPGVVIQMSKNAEIDVVEYIYCNGTESYEGFFESTKLMYTPFAPVLEALYDDDVDEMTGTVTVRDNTFYNETVGPGEFVLSKYYDLVGTVLTESYDLVVNSTHGDYKFFFDGVEYNNEFFPGHSSVGWA